MGHIEGDAGDCQQVSLADLGPFPVADVTTVLQALADPVRMAIVHSLAQSSDPRPCGSFAVPITKSTLSHHFRVLREAGVIEQRYEGTRKLTSLRRAELDAAYPGLLDSVLSAVDASGQTHQLPAIIHAAPAPAG